MENFQLIGEVTLQLRDVNPDGSIGPVVDSIVKENLITDHAVRLLLNGSSIGPYIAITSDTTPPSKQYPYVATAAYYGAGAGISGITSPQWFEESGPNPMYCQFNLRFDAPAVTRSINGVFLAGTNTAAATINATTKYSAVTLHGMWMHTHVALDTTCTQSTTQVLDVIYRLKWVTPATTTGVGKKALRKLARRACNVGAEGWIDTAWPIWTSNTGMAGSILDLFQTNGPSTFPSVSSTVVASRFQKKLNWTLSTAQMNGAVIGSQAWGNTGTNGTYTWAPIQSNTASCVQPIHNHSSTATTTPFQDVSYLANGTGQLSAAGTWTNPDYPKFIKIDITGSGAVGTSTYRLRVRKNLGFDGNVWTSAPGAWLPWFATNASAPSVFTNSVVTHNLIEPEPVGTTFNATTTGPISHSIEKYNFTSVITYDLTGITYASTVALDVRNFDALSTPALSVTGIKQVSVAADGRAWVACKNTGLWWVNPLTNTVTHMSIPGVTQECHGVDIGRNGSIWALMNGGLCSSFDNGANWTVYNASSSPSLNFTGISDSNWASVNFIRVDPTHVDDRVALVRDNATAVLQTTAMVWWSVASPTPVGVVNSSIVPMRTNTNCFNVSDTDGFWVGIGGTGLTVNKFTFGSATFTTLVSYSGLGLGNQGGSNPNFYPQGIFFEKDAGGADNLYCINSGMPGGSLYIGTAMVTQAGVVTGITPNGTNANNRYFTRPCYLGKGMWTWSVPDSYQLVGPLCFDATPSGGALAYLGEDSYGWNGSTWAIGNANGKPTHAGQEALVEGITLAFTNGATGTSFVSGDFYTFGVCKGLLKDNATTAQGSMNFYYAPVTVSSDIDNSGVVGALSTYAPNTPITWGTLGNVTVDANYTTLSVVDTTNDGFTIMSNEVLTGDFAIEWTSPSYPTVYNSGAFGIGDQNGLLLAGFVTDGTATNANQALGTPIASLGQWTTALPSTASTNSSFGIARSTITIWKLVKSGTSLTAYTNGTQRWTSATFFTDMNIPLRIVHWWPQNTTGVMPIPKILTNTAMNGVNVGISANSTGKYDSAFYLFDDVTSAMSFSLNGTPVAAVWADGNMAPGVNEVAVNSSARAIICNAADVGKTLTGSYTYVKNPNS